MKLRVDRIQDQGHIVEIDNDDWALEAASESLEGEVDWVRGTIRARAFGDQVQVTGQLDASLKRPCDRCLELLTGVLETEVELAYVPVRPDLEESRALAADELDIGFYDGGQLDLGVVFREHFALTGPARLLCGAPGFDAPEECLAPGNDEAGTSKQVDPRFAALKGLKLGD